MPNAAGQPQPWERAKVTFGAWWRLLQRVTQEHVKADFELRDFYTKGAAVTAEDLRTHRTRSERWQRSWWDVLGGDQKVIRELMKGFDIDPSDESVA